MRDIVVEMTHHIEDAIRGFREMGQHKCVRVTILGDPPKESPLNICTYSHLSSFQAQSAYPALLLELGFKLVMYRPLSCVQNKGLNYPLFTDDL